MPNMLPIDCAEKIDPCLARFGGKTRDELLSDRFDPLLKARLVHELQRGEAGCDRHRISESVPPGTTGPSGAIFCMISRRPPTAPTGKPPPITLPSVVRSGRMP